MVQVRRASSIEGYKDIAAELEQLWGRKVSERSCYRFAHSSTDPLPAEKCRGRVVIRVSTLTAWANRNRLAIGD